jgi:F-type H+-transporting ATPase subunit epsilon
MATTLQVDVVSAETSIYSGQAEMVVAPGAGGELGILPRHAPLITQIRPGALQLKVPGETDDVLVFVSGGILEVQPGAVTVLADTAIRARDLDEAKALEAKRLAEEAMSKQGEGFNYAAASAELAEAMGRLAAITKLRSQLKGGRG